jgi:hypothetical protein
MTLLTLLSDFEIAMQDRSSSLARYKHCVDCRWEREIAMGELDARSVQESWRMGRGKSQQSHTSATRRCLGF